MTNVCRNFFVSKSSKIDLKVIDFLAPGSRSAGLTNWCRARFWLGPLAPAPTIWWWKRGINGQRIVQYCSS